MAGDKSKIMGECIHRLINRWMDRYIYINICLFKYVNWAQKIHRTFCKRRTEHFQWLQLELLSHVAQFL